MFRCAGLQHALHFGTSQTPMQQNVLLVFVQSTVVTFTRTWAADCRRYLRQKRRTCSWGGDNELGTGTRQALSDCQNQTESQDSQKLSGQKNGARLDGVWDSPRSDQACAIS